MRREVEIMLTSDSGVACPSTYRRRLVGHPEGCAAAACWHFFRRSNHGIPIMSWMRKLMEMGEMTPTRRKHTSCCDLFTSCLSLLTLIINDMKRIYKKVFKSKKSSLGSIHGPGPATSTSTHITDLMPASDATASAQVTAGVSVSIQLRPSHL
jgi:hypothetical protein